MAIKVGGGKRGRKSDPAALYGTYTEACARYGLGETSIRALIRDGHIRAVTIGKRVLVDFSSGDAYFASLSSPVRRGRPVHQHAA